MDSACPLSNPFQSECLNKIFQNQIKNLILCSTSSDKSDLGQQLAVAAHQGRLRQLLRRQPLGRRVLPR